MRRHNAKAARPWLPVILLLGLAAAVIVLAVIMLGGEEEPSEETARPSGPSVMPQPIEPRSGLFDAPPPPKRRSPQEKALDLIGEYEERLKTNPNDEENPVILMAMGNLYRQKLMDYEKAAECYEQIVYDHPDSPQVRSAYLQLSTCYEQLNAGERSNRLHLRMIERFPEGSQERLFARSKLGWE